MSTLILDIETVGEQWESLGDTTQQVLTRWIDRSAASPEQRAAQLSDVKEGLGLSPLTGRIVAMGMYDVERARGVVFFETEGSTTDEVDTGEYMLKPRTEAAMLRDFWEGARSYDTFVTFGGRAFDIPYITLRSLVHGITPTRNLLSNRYLSSQRDTRHIDLQDQFSFYGAVRRKQALHLYCRAFGIESPKTAGVSAEDIGRLFAEKQYETIARYNSRDITATTQLYEIYQAHLGVFDISDGGGTTFH